MEGSGLLVRRRREKQLILILSIALNFILLFLFWLQGELPCLAETSNQIIRYTLPRNSTNLKNQPLVIAEHGISRRKLLLPMTTPWDKVEEDRRTARLTHVVMPFHVRQVPKLEENLKRWKLYPPCALSQFVLNDSSDEAPFYRRTRNPRDKTDMPFGHDIRLVFYLDGFRNEKVEERLFEAFYGLAPETRSCFNGLDIRYAGLKDDDDKYLTGSRLMAENLIKNGLGLIDPYYVYYMEPDCLPVRSFWLTLIDAATRPPNPAFWLKGSIYNGNPNVINRNFLYNMLHINGNAIYNLHDKSFRDWYFDEVRPFITKYYNAGAYDTDWYKFLYWPPFFPRSRQIVHKFQFSAFLKNYWHTNYTVNQIRESNEFTVLVHGGYPNYH